MGEAGIGFGLCWIWPAESFRHTHDRRSAVSILARIYPELSLREVQGGAWMRYLENRGMTEGDLVGTVPRYLHIGKLMRNAGLEEAYGYT